MKKIMLIFFMIIFNNFYIFANENLDINDTNKNIFEEHKPKKEIEKKFIDDKNIEFKDHILPDISINKLKENLTDKNETIIDTNKKIDILSLENKKLSKEEKAKIEYIRNKNLEIKKLQLKINEISRKIEYIQNTYRFL